MCQYVNGVQEGKKSSVKIIPTLQTEKVKATCYRQPAVTVAGYIYGKPGSENVNTVREFGADMNVVNQL